MSATNPDVFLKVGDLLPALEATLQDANGAVNLTDATVRFVMEDSAHANKVNAAATITAPATTGQVKYAWVSGDTNTAGIYCGEFVVTFAGALEATFPNSGYILIQIEAEVSKT